MADLEYLSEVLEINLNKAKNYHSNNNYALAKKYYLLSAETLLKMSKQSKGKLKTSYYNRAKNLISIADKLMPLNDEVEDKQDDVVVPIGEISLEDAIKELFELEGLYNVKNQINGWVEQIKVFNMRKLANLPTPDITYHMVFKGNPGTGKTTVARIVAKIYKALGIVSKGQLVEVARSDLVQGYVGQTAIKTKEVVKKAIGGVLFIDEAYDLARKNENDFGQEAINTLLKLMEDYRNDLVVIAAGYSELIDNFVNSNPGLRSRFKNFIIFNDYDGEELYNIFEKMCLSNSYIYNDEVAKYLRNYTNHLYYYRDKNFGNAREIRNLFELIVQNQSKRVASISSVTKEQLCEIILDDLPYEIIK